MTDISAYMTRFGAMYDRLHSGTEEERDFQKAVVKWMGYISSDYQRILESVISSSLQTGDFETLHRCFFQVTRTRLLPGMAGGLDHCQDLWPLLDCAACEGPKELYRLLPPELGMSRNGHPMLVCAMNLLMCLLYNREGVPRFDEAAEIRRAEKFLSAKRPLWERSVVGFLLCFLRRDTAGMTDHLQSACASYGQLKTAAKYQKLQCLNAYGLVVLAKMLLPQEAFSELRPPEAPNFSGAYLSWRLTQAELPLEPCFTYPEPYTLANRILAQPVAVRRLFQPGLEREDLTPRERNTWYQDEAAMLEQFIAGMETA